MPCYHPLQAYQTADGGVVFQELQRHDTTSSLQLPCGQCCGCRIQRSQQWAIRCLHEAQLHKHNAYITLTYNDQNLPPNGNLQYRDFQTFMRRLRKAAWQGNDKQRRPTPLYKENGPIRFYMAGEYGEDFGRPHFHACLFNCDFADKKYWKESDASTTGKATLYTSETLDKIWGKGFASIGQVNFQTAAYIARYIMKKITGQQAETHYKKLNLKTGEITIQKPEFNKMSLKPGIGKNWLEKYKTDVYPHGTTIIKGKEIKAPKYYDKIFKKLAPLEYEQMQWKRRQVAQKNWYDNTDARLAVRETVTNARIQTLKRKLT